MRGVVPLAWLALVCGDRALAQAPAACSASDSAGAKTIRDRLNRWVEETNRGDRAASTIWAPRVTGWFPSGAEFSDSAAFAVAGLPSSGPKPIVTFEVKIDDVAVSGGVAAVHDIWRERRRFGERAVSVEREIRGSELWRCQPDGSWKIARWVSAPEHWVRSK
jgi:hypothetical protein